MIQHQLYAVTLNPPCCLFTICSSFYAPEVCIHIRLSTFYNQFVFNQKMQLIWWEHKGVSTIFKWRIRQFYFLTDFATPLKVKATLSGQLIKQNFRGYLQVNLFFIELFCHLKKNSLKQWQLLIVMSIG